MPGGNGGGGGDGERVSKGNDVASTSPQSSTPWTRGVKNSLLSAKTCAISSWRSSTKSFTTSRTRSGDLNTHTIQGGKHAT